MTARDTRAYAAVVGEKLRLVRRERAWSLQTVEEKSGGRWKAVVVGSYERADRAITIARLLELADFYGVPVTEFLPVVAVPEPTTRQGLIDEAHNATRRAVELLDRAAELQRSGGSS